MTGKNILLRQIALFIVALVLAYKLSTIDRSGLSLYGWVFMGFGLLLIPLIFLLSTNFNNILNLPDYKKNKKAGKIQKIIYATIWLLLLYQFFFT